MADASSVELIRGLYDYHRWANHRLFDIAKTLGEDATRRDVGKHFSFPTLKGMFAHIYAADTIWLLRWKGVPTGGLMTDADFASMADLRTRWDALELEQRTFVDALSASNLERVVNYKNTAGTPFSVPLWRLLQHVPNHATHHRSEAATMLTIISGSPPDTGINTYAVGLTR
jgi:uncharacterized damage-inducible protein DinB